LKLIGVGRNIMALSIQSLAKQRGEDVYYNDKYRIMIGQHIEQLRTSTDSQEIAVSEQSANRQLGDFYGLLLELDVLPKYHWIVMAVNGLKQPNEYDGNNTIIMPSVNEIDRLTQVFLANHSI